VANEPRSQFPVGEGVWHKNGAMGFRKARKAPPPLNRARLEELALRYVGRFATTRAKLRDYLARKVRERGWEEGSAPDLEQLAERFAERGYVDDAAFALSKSRSLTGRGYGKRRVIEKLRMAGVGEDDSAAARELAESEAVAAALRFAERRRLGPYAASAPDPREREKVIAAMVRAGHDFALSRAIARLAPGTAVDPESLAEHAGRNPI
jgi:regulatory protein